MLDYPLVDVLDLMREHIDRNRRNEAEAATQATARQSSTGERVIYRRAGDDWF